MELRGAARAAGEDEAAQVLQILIHPVDLALEPIDLRGHDAQRALYPFGGGEIGAEIEQFVLDAAEHGPRRLVPDRRQSGADRRIRLIDVADRGHARIGLGDARAVDKPGVAGVAGAGVDLVEPDQGRTLSRRCA